MDRRIRAILVANNIDELALVEIVDYNNGVLEIVKNDKTQYISLEGRVCEEGDEEQLDEIKTDVFEIKTQDKKIENIIKDSKNNGFKVEMRTIIEEVDDDIFSEKKDEIDDIFNSEEKIDDNIDDFNVDLEDNFNLDAVFEEEKKVLKSAEKLKITRRGEKKSNENDDFINLL